MRWESLEENGRVHARLTAPREWVGSVYEGMRELGLKQCKTDPCVWHLFKATRGTHLRVFALFHIDDFMLAGRVNLVGKSSEREVHSKWKSSEWQQDICA